MYALLRHCTCKRVCIGAFILIVAAGLLVASPPHREARAVNPAGTCVNWYSPGSDYTVRDGGFHTADRLLNVRPLLCPPAGGCGRRRFLHRAANGQQRQTKMDALLLVKRDWCFGSPMQETAAVTTMPIGQTPL